MTDSRSTSRPSRHALDAAALLATSPHVEECSWTENDVVSYALSTGFGQDELERGELPFLYEGRGLLVSPGFAMTLPKSGWLDATGWHRDFVVVAARHLEVFSPLLPADTIEMTSTVADVWPDRTDEGCLITVRTEAHRLRDRRALFALSSVFHARSDRLEGGHGKPADAPGFARPEREPDFVVAGIVGFSQSVLFRWLTGGPARYVDTDAARRAGFERPVVPADCLAGVVVRHVLGTVCDYDPTLLRGLSVNVTAAVYVDQAIHVRMWQDGPVIAFDAATESSAATVLDGRAVLAT